MTSDHARLREIWRGMLKRCENEACKDNAHYRSRRIRVCDGWHDFDTFEMWAMSHGYKDGLTLDRANNNLGYFPGNCRWVSRKTQGMNRSTTTYYTYGGKTRSLKGWSEETGLPSTTILRRLELGWSLEETLTRPVQKHIKK